eukprot:scaffold258527_cov16-Prasinocladus_malaysianus.AAC.1
MRFLKQQGEVTNSPRRGVVFAEPLFLRAQDFVGLYVLRKDSSANACPEFVAVVLTSHELGVYICGTCHYSERQRVKCGREGFENLCGDTIRAGGLVAPQTVEVLLPEKVGRDSAGRVSQGNGTRGSIAGLESDWRQLAWPWLVCVGRVSRHLSLRRWILRRINFPWKDLCPARHSMISWMISVVSPSGTVQSRMTRESERSSARKAGGYSAWPARSPTGHGFLYCGVRAGTSELRWGGSAGKSHYRLLIRKAEDGCGLIG